MDQQDLEILDAHARGLVLDAVENAGSGHPGAAYTLAPTLINLYMRILRHNPGNPDWFGRDRFVLSCGHVVLAQYLGLFASGYDLSVADLRQYRQGGGCPGHPELGMTPGVEISSGPLGFGLSASIGMAAGLREWWLRGSESSDSAFSVPLQRVFCLVSDGDLMEGVSYESSSIAGTQKLGNLCLIYDSNRITIDGAIGQTFTEDVEMRFRSQGWDVVVVPARENEEISVEILSQAIENWDPTGNRPLLCVLESTIAVGIEGFAGSSISHGSPLGPVAVGTVKQALGLDPARAFQGEDYFSPFRIEARVRGSKSEREWNSALARTGGELDVRAGIQSRVAELAACLDSFAPLGGLSLRAANKEALLFLQDRCEWVVLGSADLTDSTGVPRSIQELSGASRAFPFPKSRVPFGVREKSMAGYAIGLAALGMLPVVSTYLAFADFQRAEIRLAAMMRMKVVFLFTHDAVMIGGDGPTHQPVEQLASLRAVPGLPVVRPANSGELMAVWKRILQDDGPVCLVLTREEARDLSPRQEVNTQAGSGGYVISESQYSGDPDLVIVATGSELALGEAVWKALDSDIRRVRLVSLPCLEWFLESDSNYQLSVCGPPSTPTVVMEAGSKVGWAKFVRDSVLYVSVESFGESNDSESLRQKFRLRVEDVVEDVGGFF